ncbi:hypothetical protein GVI59_17825 [Acetobacter sicerae]|nr:hypothetical protein [Acetobacter sicerae]
MRRFLGKLSKHTEFLPMQTAEAVTQDAQTKVRAICDAFGRNLCVKEIISRLARLLSITDRQAKSVYYGEWQMMPAFVYMRILTEYRSTLKRLEKRAEQEAAMYRALNQEMEQRWDASFDCGAQRGSGKKQSAAGIKLFSFENAPRS